MSPPAEAVPSVGGLPLREALRARTAGAHAALESTLGLLGPSLDRAAYVRYLRRVGGYHGAVERRLDRLGGVLPDAPERFRAALAAADLDALGAPPPVAPPASSLPALDSVGAQLGAAYVFEGSTLGGRVLRRALTEHLGLDDDALRYVSGYGAETAARWRTFCLALDRAPESAHGPALAAATATFEGLRAEVAR